MTHKPAGKRARRKLMPRDAKMVAYIAVIRSVSALTSEEATRVLTAAMVMQRPVQVNTEIIPPARKSPKRRPK